MSGVLAEPDVEIEVIGLLRPEHARQRLAHHSGSVVVDSRWCDGAIGLVGCRSAGGDYLVEPGEGILMLERRRRTQAHAIGDGALGGNDRPPMGGNFGALALGVHG